MARVSSSSVETLMDDMDSLFNGIRLQGTLKNEKKKTKAVDDGLEVELATYGLSSSEKKKKKRNSGYSGIQIYGHLFNSHLMNTENMKLAINAFPYLDLAILSSDKKKYKKKKKMRVNLVPSSNPEKYSSMIISLDLASSDAEMSNAAKKWMDMDNGSLSEWIKANKNRFSAAGNMVNCLPCPYL